MLQGDTSNLPLTNIFQTLALNQQTGVLRVIYKGTQRALAIRDGHVALICEQPYQSLVLPQVLERLGIMSPSEYQNVLATAREERSPGEALSERHVITEEQIFGTIRAHLIERVYETCHWNGARYKFEVRCIDPELEMFGLGKYRAAVELPVNSLLMEVARREDEWERIEALIPSDLEVFEVDTDDPRLADFSSGDGLDETELQTLLKELGSGSRTLVELQRLLKVPRFFLFSTVRALISEGLAHPIGLERKRQAAESMRAELKQDRVAYLSRSILADDPSDTETRRRLVGVLERQRANPDELAVHYRRLAEDHHRDGNTNDERTFLEKHHKIDPSHVETLGDLARHALLAKREKEWNRYFTAFVKQIHETKRYELGAEQLVQYCELRSEDASLLAGTGHVLDLAGQTELAVFYLDRAAECYQKKRDYANLHKLVDKLGELDEQHGAAWRRQLHLIERAQTSGKPHRSRVRLALLVLLVAAVTTAAIYEWSARIAFAETVAHAESLADDGELDGAERDLERFREAYRYSLVSQSVSEVRVRLERKYREAASKQDEKAAEHSAVTIAEIETQLSKATALAQRGRYKEALELFEGVNPERLSKTAQTTVRRERARLRQYLESATKLYGKAREALEASDWQQANQRFNRLLLEFPYSPEAAESSSPVFIETLPPRAKVRIDGVPLAGPPFIGMARPGHETLVQLSSPGFEPRVVTFDPAQEWTLSVALQKKCVALLSADSKVEAIPLILDDRVVLGSRAGKVLAYDSTNGQLMWEFRLDGLGDALGAIRSYRDQVVFIATDGRCYSVNRDGNERQSFELPSTVGIIRNAMTPPDVRGLAYVTAERALLCLDFEQRQVRWVESLDSEASSPALLDKQIAVALGSDVVAGYSRTSGERLWTHPVDGLLRGSLVAMADYCYVADVHGRVICLRGSDRHVMWYSPVDGRVAGQLAVSGERLVGVTADGRLFTRHRLTGEVTSDDTSVGADFEIGPTCSEDTAFVIDNSGKTTAWNLKQLVPLWRYEPKPAASGEPGAPEVELVCRKGVVLVTDNDAGVHLLNAWDGVK